MIPQKSWKIIQTCFATFEETRLFAMKVVTSLSFLKSIGGTEPWLFHKFWCAAMWTKRQSQTFFSVKADWAINFASTEKSANKVWYLNRYNADKLLIATIGPDVNHLITISPTQYTSRALLMLGGKILQPKSVGCGLKYQDCIILLFFAKA